jgi:SET domain-containing protein
MQIKLSHTLFIDETPGKGRGVFTREELPPMKVIETSSVLVMDAAARILLDQTALHDYIFEWGVDEDQCVVAWGYISMYNHSYTANCEYFMDFEKSIISIKTVRKITQGEELTINYNGDWDDKKLVWFETK